MQWQVCLGFMFLIVVSVIMWGASQGWYSKKVKKSKDTSKNTSGTVHGGSDENCDELRNEIERLKGKIFEQSMELDTKAAKNAEMTRQLEELMNTINDLTTRLQNAETTNAQLSQSLKNALEDLDKTRRQLQECSAKLLAKQITNAVCHMTPETANLIR